MKHSTLADLPPELLDQIVAYLPTASCLSHLSQTSRALRGYVDHNAWSIFARTRFPTLAPSQPTSWKQTVRTLTTRSRAWDRRAIVARFIEPTGSIRAYPGAAVVDRWKRPGGQTVGFTPRLDACVIGDEKSATEATDLLAYSAGAQVVLRKQTRHFRRHVKHRTATQWSMYRPLSAVEGRDDITTLHILRNQDSKPTGRCHLIVGTANGDLQHLSIPLSDGERKIHTYFTTQGLSVQSSSVSSEHGQTALLAAALDHTQLALYKIDPDTAKTSPVSQINVSPAEDDANAAASKNHRLWSTQFLSHDRLAVGFGPSTEPLRVYAITPDGLKSSAVREYQLEAAMDSLKLDINPTRAKALKTSVYPIVPVPDRPELFFSGAYDGLIRLHDMRSQRAAELIVQDAYDDSAIYSLLLRGQETLIAGTSRHSHLKVFDARMNGKAYSYLDVTNDDNSDNPGDDFSLYLSTRASWHTSNRWRTDGSIYSLASPSPTSPYFYAGVQNGVIELASTEILHRQPDPLYFEPWPRNHDKPSEWNGWSSKSVLNIARYEGSRMNGQKSLWDTWQTRHSSVGDSYLDARWKGVKVIDLD